jgi:drug/metabolite transporter (DMT)-like permease
MSISIARRDLVFLTLAAASWGVATVISKRAVEEIPPFTLLPLQLAVSVAVLAVLMRASGMPLRGSPPILARLGVLNPGIAYALGLAGLTWITASLSVLLWALEPLLILLLAGLFLREGITPRLVALSLVAAAGMVLIVVTPASDGEWPGVVLSVAGIACCAGYTIIARRFVATSDSTAQVVLAQQVYALGFSIVVGAAVGLIGVTVWPTSVSPLAVVSAAASGVLYYAAAYWLYLTALRTVPASLAASSFFLIPVFGVVAGSLLLGDRLEPIQWLGVAIAAMAVAAIALSPARGVRREAAIAPLHEPSSSSAAGGT